MVLWHRREFSTPAGAFQGSLQIADVVHVESDHIKTALGIANFVDDGQIEVAIRKMRAVRPHINDFQIECMGVKFNQPLSIGGYDSEVTKFGHLNLLTSAMIKLGYCIKHRLWSYGPTVHR